MDVLFENNTNEEINYKLIEKVIISLEILIEQQMYYHFR